jgi:hypothetical protein
MSKGSKLLMIVGGILLIGAATGCCDPKGDSGFLGAFGLRGSSHTPRRYPAYAQVGLQNSTLNTGVKTGVMRAGPGYSNRQIDSIPHGSIVTALGKRGSWYKIRYGSHVGYMHRDILWFDRVDANYDPNTGHTNASRGTSRSQTKYGALTYNSATGWIGHSYDYSTTRGAREAALNKCGGGACRVVVEFRNQCAAYVVGLNGAAAWGKANTRGAAEQAALRQCYSSNGQSCSVKVWGCTSNR